MESNDQTNWRQIGKSRDGILKRGQTRSRKAHKFRKVCSIPSKYETFFNDPTDVRENDGFLRRTHRFVEVVNTNPGPGQYVNKKDVETKSTSFSKRGYGNMASHTYRFHKLQPMRGIPGPGKYTAGSCFMPKLTDGSIQGNAYQPSAVFKSETFDRSILAHDMHCAGDLGPGTYDPKAQGHYEDTNPRPIQTSQRFEEVTLYGEEAPESNPLDSLGQTKAFQKWRRKKERLAKLPQAVFRSTTERKFVKPDEDIPGPGKYNVIKNWAPPIVELEVRRSNEKEKMVPDFVPKGVVDNPGPGHYFLKERPEKLPTATTTSSAFKSTTQRGIGVETTSGANKPGPGCYDPNHVPSKYTFHKISDDLWL